MKKTPENKHQAKKLAQLLTEVANRPEAKFDRKIKFKLFVRFKPGQIRDKYSWVDWWLVEHYIAKGTTFHKKTNEGMRMEAIYYKIQECATNVEQIIVYDKRSNRNKYQPDEVMLEIVKNRVRKDFRPAQEKELYPISSLIN
jgi:hypothetical protein